jgi:hypothetical protein
MDETTFLNFREQQKSRREKLQTLLETRVGPCLQKFAEQFEDDPLTARPMLKAHCVEGDDEFPYSVSLISFSDESLSFKLSRLGIVSVKTNDRVVFNKIEDIEVGTDGTLLLVQRTSPIGEGISRVRHDVNRLLGDWMKGVIDSEVKRDAIRDPSLHWI